MHRIVAVTLRVVEQEISNIANRQQLLTTHWKVKQDGHNDTISCHNVLPLLQYGAYVSDEVHSACVVCM